MLRRSGERTASSVMMGLKPVAWSRPIDAVESVEVEMGREVLGVGVAGEEV